MEKRQKLPKRRGRVNESLDDFLKSLKKNCNSTIDPSPRKRGRPSESLKTHNKFQCYTGPFSKRGRPPINLVVPGYTTNDQVMKDNEKEEVSEASHERSPSPKMVEEKEQMEE